MTGPGSEIQDRTCGGRDNFGLTGGPYFSTEISFVVEVVKEREDQS